MRSLASLTAIKTHTPSVVILKIMLAKTARKPLNVGVQPFMRESVMARLKLASLIAAFGPWGPLRPLVYRLLTGARIGRDVRLSFGVYIDSPDVTLGDGARVGRMTSVRDVDSVDLAPGARVGVRNHISRLAQLTMGADSEIGAYVTVSGIEHDGPKGSLIMGDHALVTGRHHIDCTCTVRLGDHTVLAGVFSSIWTHGYNWESLKDVIIGDRCYLGASVKVGSGVTLADYTVVAMGTVVTTSFDKPNTLIGGVPAKILRHDYNPKAEPAND